MIDFEFYCEPDGALHIAKHNVSETEIDEAFNERPYLYQGRPDGSYLAFSRLSSGRILQVAFRKVAPKKYFIITAFDLEDPAVLEYVRRELE